MRKFRKCEEELKAKINEFEEVFNVLTQLKTEYDWDKQQKVQSYLNKQK